jgi:hypothetical protein
MSISTSYSALFIIQVSPKTPQGKIIAPTIKTNKSNGHQCPFLFKHREPKLLSHARSN